MERRTEETVTEAAHRTPSGRIQGDVLKRIENRVLWIATYMVHHANKVRPNSSGVKVGGHQASSASMVSLMTALWFEHLRAEDQVSVKPHASPVLHAINYLLGNLDVDYLEQFRSFQGLQAYPSRPKDPDRPDYSTGSVGIGATAPIWGALAQRYVRMHFGARGHGRQIALLGDAELDEGACWEAVLDSHVADLGEVLWVVDVNGQSLDRATPTHANDRHTRLFEAVGWHVIELRYGSRLAAVFQMEEGDLLRQRLDTIGSEEYLRLLRASSDEVHDRLAGCGPTREPISRLIKEFTPDELMSLLRDVGGHDLSAIGRAFQDVDGGRPTVILAHTLKGYGLPMEAHPGNHSALLTQSQLESLAVSLHAEIDQPWRPLDPGSPEERACDATRTRLHRLLPAPAPELAVPTQFELGYRNTMSTQAALGRFLLDLNRLHPEISKRVVTVSPDVASSTNLAGWINKVGVFSVQPAPYWFEDDSSTLLHWREAKRGQHIELGIAEGNLVGLLTELGQTWDRWEQPLIPIGTIYDTFVTRALEPWSFGVYAGSQSILIGTPSGVTLAPEGGAHQSVITPSIGLEQPGVVAYEPAFAKDLEWCLLHAIDNVGKRSGSSHYLRLSTRPIDQELSRPPEGDARLERRRRQVLDGGYVLVDADDAQVSIAVMGAVVPEALEAASRLHDLGVPARVVCVTSADRLFRAFRGRQGAEPATFWILDELFGKALPLVTVLDGHPHTLAFLGAVSGAPGMVNLGVAEFGQSGSLTDLYGHFGIDTKGIISAALRVVAS